ncbi:AsmA family protein [Bradyrhizobium sp. G127]|uniref:AsmA family protein n=1 Tax=Bradyrhizobium sp. G127 TaxID=2904800 RepID=UPI001F1F46A2|nr:AsmA family protein [Bradyrhizobium sp. G127]MCF2522112.1 AsmA family protein [Bradyrhizobium sp. G127]
MAQGIKRLAMPVAALLAAALIGLIAISWMIDQNAVRLSVERQIRAVTGLDLKVDGDVRVSVFPGSSITLRQVGLKGAGSRGGGDEPLTVDQLTANLRLLPLLMRRYEIADVTLERPRINVKRAADGRSNWSGIIETLARTIKPGIDSPVSFSEILIKDGVLTYQNDARSIDETLDGIDLSLAWPSISRSFAATGQFDWRGERVDGSLSIADFIAALSGDRSGIKVRVASAPLKFAFDGAVANRTSLLMEGTLAADSPSLRNALRWTGQPAPGTGGLGRFSLKARTNVVGESIALTNVNLELDGNTAEGVITYSNNDRQTVQATLAADALDFTPYIDTVRLLASGARDWNRQLFDLRGLSATDLDMRLSAAKVTIGPSKLGRTALGANLRSGTLALSIGEAQIYGGILKGSFGITRADTDADVKAQFQFTDVDLASCASELFGVSRLTGRGNLSFALEATGASPFALAQSLDGTATLTGRDGAIGGLNIEQLLRRLERRPLSGAGNFRTGSTPFNTLSIAIRFRDGVATAEDAQLEGATTRIMLTGTASVPSREYDLKGVASLVVASDAPPAFQLPFVVQGPWDDPLIFPDSDSLIRRSPASAPLLDSLKDRKTRDAVKSVIDRFTGGGKKPAVEPTAQPQAAIPQPVLPPPVAPAIPAAAPAPADTPAPAAATPASPGAETTPSGPSAPVPDAPANIQPPVAAESTPEKAD